MTGENDNLRMRPHHTHVIGPDYSPMGRYLEDDVDPTADEHDALDDCTKCTAGRYGPKEGADDSDDCYRCEAGASSEAGAAYCVACGAGA